MRLFPLGNLKASALFYALLIATLVALISTAFISLSYFHRNLRQQDFLQDRLLRNVQSGLNVLSTDQGMEAFQETLDLFGDGQDSVDLSASNWGLFRLIQVRAFAHTSINFRQMYRAALLGKVPDALEQSALYLQDNSKPVAVSGTTLIKGKAYLPRAGLQKGQIPNHPYQRGNLMEGTRELSQAELPLVDSIFLQKLSTNFELHNLPTPHSLPDSIHQLFRDSTLFVGGKIIRIDQFWKGNICIVADSLIHITANAQLEDVLLFAPHIEVASGFKGSVQLFATESIKLDPGAKLYYPSVVGLLVPLLTNRRNPIIVLEKNTLVEGLVFSLQMKKGTNYPLIQTKEGCQITGQVFSDGPMDLRGKVLGNITGQYFSLRLEGRAYHNHLLDLEIQPGLRPEAYLSPLFLINQQSKKIAKWLN